MTLTRRGMVRGSAALAITPLAGTLTREPRPARASCQLLPAASPAAVAMNRLSFGPSVGARLAFEALGATDDERYEAWVAQQLSPATIDDSACEQRLAATRLKIRYGSVSEARYLTLLNAPLSQLWALNDHPERAERTRPYDEVRVATWIRAIYSRRQLFEVLVDFWHNHFNVRAPLEGTIMATWPLFDRVIRTHALGNFRTFVEEVGKSVAMVYASDKGAGDEGGNESYARELFLLHTLGPESCLRFYADRGQIPTISSGGKTYPRGYIEADIYEASRCLTGWTIANGRDGRPDTGDFFYKADWHDTSAKTMLAPRPLPGVAPAPNIPAHQGALEDGRAVFDLVCEHPETARHLCTRLARRLIADTPPASVVDAAVQVWLDNRGAPDQIARVVRAIVLAPECRATFGRKARRPLEALWAYLRGTGADLPDDLAEVGGDTGKGGHWSSLLHRADLSGHRLFGWDTSSDHPDTAGYWANTNGVLRHWNLFYTVTQNWGGNVQVDIVGQTNMAASCVQIVDAWAERLCGFALTEATRQELIAFLAAGGNPHAPPAPTPGAPERSGHETIADRVQAMVHLLAMSPDFNLR